VKVDPRNIELADAATVAMYRDKTGPEKLRIVDGMFRAARAMIRAGVLTEHPDWPPERIDRETVRRLSRGTI
jgi:hypothetical protein